MTTDNPIVFYDQAETDRDTAAWGASRFADGSMMVCVGGFVNVGIHTNEAGVRNLIALLERSLADVNRPTPGTPGGSDTAGEGMPPQGRADEPAAPPKTRGDRGP